jgi:hypothetical protein
MKAIVFIKTQVLRTLGIFRHPEAGRHLVVLALIMGILVGIALTLQGGETRDYLQLVEAAGVVYGVTRNKNPPVK